MRQGDVRVDVEYALPLYPSSLEAVKVRVTGAPVSGVAPVVILDVPAESPAGLTRRRAGRGTVETRRLFGTWPEWELECERRGAVQAVWERDHQERLDEIANLARADPDRPLPDSYAIDWWAGQDVRWDNTTPEASARLAEAAALPGKYSAALVAARFKDLPAALCRDLVAALSDRRGPFMHQYERPSSTIRMAQDSSASASELGPEQGRGPERHDCSGGANDVATVLARAARVLDVLRQRGGDRYTLHPDRYLVAADADFVEAVVADVKGRGGEVVLPRVPSLPWGQWDRLTPTEPPLVTTFGWLRVAFARTGGSKWHGLGCTRVRDSQPDDRPETRPWWQVWSAPGQELCGVCGGPGVHALLEVAHFAAASDVWHARGHTGIEPWQRQALSRLVAATLDEAAFVGEGEPSLAFRIAEELCERLPGDAEGWFTYWLVTRPLYVPPTDAPMSEREATELARQRLETVRALLPTSIALDPLPAQASLRQVQDRHRELSKRVLPDCLDRYLFGLANSR